MTVRPLPIRVDGRRIEAVLLPGDPDRRACVLLHEGLGSVQLWRDFPDQLRQATGRSVLAYSRFGHGRSDPPAAPRTPAFFHEEALEVLPEVLGQAGIREPILVGHSDGASIALIHGANAPTTATALLAPHVFVEDVTLRAIERTREQYVSGDLRRRLASRHDDPDAAFWGWCDVWLDPAFARWSLDAEAQRLAGPTLLVQGVDDPYGTLEQLDRIQAAAPGPVTRLEVAGGHSPQFDATAETVGAIARLVAELP